MLTEDEQPISDVTLQAKIHAELNDYANGEDCIAIVETAGGVLSPAPSGTTQADAYRPLRLPTFLVGDSRLGGIGSTISAWESLHTRGYDVDSIALFREDRYENHAYLKDYFAERGVHSFSIPPPPEMQASVEQDRTAMSEYYEQAARDQSVATFTGRFLKSHDKRIEDLRSMPQEAVKTIWHPFMQHRERSKDTVVAIDSAFGDHFQTYTTKQGSAPGSSAGAAEQSLLKPAFDGSASWWTQGLGHGNPQLALAAAYAAGRYGHVMFAGAVHEPALTLTQRLVDNMGNPKLSKVFFTDNGSTGMEVAVKMALRAASNRNGWTPDDNVEILGLTGSYHGDTMGTMDCSEPSIYNKKVEWYEGRGYWLDFPQVRMREGRWVVEAPENLRESLGEPKTFDSLGSIFDLEARRDEWSRYRAYLDATLSRLRKEGHKFGALIMEPIILGAGGMMFIDPLFQRCLVDAVRSTSSGINAAEDNEPRLAELDWQGMPVIFDEVFTGIYRLGRFSAASFLGTHPDILVNAKLLTGGLLPLCTTTTSEAIFETFLSDDKSDALLHGHSYTAHAMGCAVANESLNIFTKLDASEAWEDFRNDWSRAGTVRQSSPTGAAPPWSMWSQSFVAAVSLLPNVDYVIAIGSVFAVSLKDPAGSGYASTAATGFRDQLFAGADQHRSAIHSRVLGNVLYLMAAMTTSKETLQDIEETVLNALK